MRDGTHKIKIYFDTSVLSYLKQDDSPERMAATITFWEEIKKRKDLDIFLSDVTLMTVCI